MMMMAPLRSRGIVFWLREGGKVAGRLVGPSVVRVTLGVAIFCVKIMFKLVLKIVCFVCVLLLPRLRATVTTRSDICLDGAAKGIWDIC